MFSVMFFDFCVLLCTDTFGTLHTLHSKAETTKQPRNFIFLGLCGNYAVRTSVELRMCSEDLTWVSLGVKASQSNWNWIITTTLISNFILSQTTDDIVSPQGSLIICVTNKKNHTKSYLSFFTQYLWNCEDLYKEWSIAAVHHCFKVGVVFIFCCSS